MDPEEDLPRINYYTTIAPGAAANSKEPPAIPSSSGSTNSTTNNDMSLSSLPQSVLIVRGNNDDDSNFHNGHECDNVHDDDDDDDDDDDYDEHGYNGGNSSNSKIHYSNKKNSSRSSSRNHHRHQRGEGGGGVGSIRSSGIRTTTISAPSHRSHYYHQQQQQYQQKNKQHRQSSSTQHKSVFVPRELSLPNSSRRAAAAKARRNDCDGGGGGDDIEKIESYSSGSDVDDVKNYNDDDNDDSGEMERDKQGITSSKKNSKKSSTKVKKQQHFESTIDDKNDWAMEDKEGGGDGRKHDPKQQPRHRLLLLEQQKQQQQKQQQQQHYYQQEQGGSGGSSSDHGQRQSQRNHHRRLRRHHQQQQKNDSHVKSVVEDDDNDMNDKEGKKEEESDDETLKGERNRTNSPELNIHRRTVVESSSSSSYLLPPPLVSSSTPRTSSSSSLLNSCLPAAALDPKEDDTKSYFSRLDAPPTPMGPERNICRRIIGEGAAVLLQLPLVPPATSTNKSSMVDGSGDGGGGCVAKDGNYCRTSGVVPSYNNYILDEEGIRQYRQHHGKFQGKDDRLSRQPQKTAATMKEQVRASAGITDNTSLMMSTTRISQMNIQDGSSSSNSVAVITDLKRDRKADPPALGRGCDPTPLTTPVIYRRRTSVEEDGGGKKEKDTRKESSRRKKDESQSSSSISKSRTPIQVKSILKKRDAPIPITQFGKPVITKNDDEEDADRNYGSDGSESSGSEASDPDVIERKQKAASASTSNKVQYSTNKAMSVATSNNKDEDSKCSMTTAKSGLRKGKYAALNDSLVKSSSKKDKISRSSNNDDDDDVGLNNVDEAENDDKSDSNDSSNSDNDINDADTQKEDATFDSPIGNNSQRYDRSQSHYMRTADLGMTQDTIFPEQFMEDPKAKPEPHYHHPSPHPPPGVVFHIDENWICLDDGKTGSHSPIAPQAVDALVDMGYRAASNPMMWTPNVKTRKYMTEKGLRFDDIPIPGPLDEGDGTPGDTSSVLVWSGKFPHKKYHGHDVPAIRSQGIINMSPEALVDLLMDSNRVREYNKSSIGRDDELVLSDGTNLDSNPFSGQRKKRVTGVVMRGAKVVDGNAVFDSETDDEQSEQEEGGDETMDDTGSKSVRTMLSSVSKREHHHSRFVGVTKLVRTKNKPPLVRKVLEFITLLHCRALTDDQGGDGYIIVARAVTPASEAESSKKGVVHCEILLNVHIIRRLRNEKKKSISQPEKGKGGKCKNVSTSGKKAGKGDLANRCLLINVNHMKSPLVPSLVAKTVGLSAALNFITDIRATS